MKKPLTLNVKGELIKRLLLRKFNWSINMKSLLNYKHFATKSRDTKSPQRWLALAGLALTLVPAAQALDVQVTFQNLAPENGLWIMRPWVGFHDGTYNAFTVGQTASAGIQALAEDGNVAPQISLFSAALPGNVNGMIGGPTPPGSSLSAVYSLNPLDANNRYFSYAMMVIPGNDGFVGNTSSTAHQMFDGSGNFIGGSFIILGSAVFDAGTELNDELPVNTAFLGQATPNTGTDENGVIHTHPGFNAPGTGGILDGSFMGFTFGSADFKQPGYQVALVSFQVVPEPTTVALFGMGLFGFAVSLRRRNRK